MTTGSHTAGVDEAGRGPLAGPVVVAAVILDPARPAPDGLTDSKKLSARRRETLVERIQDEALALSVVAVDIAEIEKLNILGATMAGMERAVARLRPVPEHVLVDGNRCPDLPIRAQAVIGGDGLVPAISAASILAKVTRDRLMQSLDREYPEYGFARHKGYGTRAHLEALSRLGPCPAHRNGFAPVRAAREQFRLDF